MRVAIVGICGNIGMGIAAGLLRTGFLNQGRNALIGIPNTAQGSMTLAHYLRDELLATSPHRSQAKQFTLTTDFREINADIVVIAACSGIMSGREFERKGLTRHNRPILRLLATNFQHHGSGHEFFVICTNPIELGVSIFSTTLNAPERVIGIGCYHDSVRFSHLLQERFDGTNAPLLLGEHGPNAVPIWPKSCRGGAILTRTFHNRRLATLSLVNPHLMYIKSHGLDTLSTQERLRLVNSILMKCREDVRVSLGTHLSHVAGGINGVGGIAIVMSLIAHFLCGKDVWLPLNISITTLGALGQDTVVGLPTRLCSKRRLVGSPRIEHLQPFEIVELENAGTAIHRYLSQVAASQ